MHTSRFTMDESQLPVGAALHAATALRWLEGAAGEGASPPRGPHRDEL